MTETVLKALMRLFAIIANIIKDDASEKARIIVETYLGMLLSPDKVSQYIIMFDYYSRNIKEKESKNPEKKLSLYSVKILTICEQINEELQHRQKLLVLLQLIEVINYDKIINPEETDFVRTAADALRINQHDFNNCMAFILQNPSKIPDKSDVLLISGNFLFADNSIKLIYKNYLNGEIHVLRLSSGDLYVFRYEGKDDALYLNGREIEAGRTYVFEKGSAIKSHKFTPIYYSDVVGRFLQSDEIAQITLNVKDVEFHYEGTLAGIQKINFTACSGQLIGIMGGSGVGKSTFLNVLNGNLQPHHGNIVVNGYSLRFDSEKLKGVIGFIPQDDLLIEELTVFENLYFNACLCFGNIGEEQVVDRVNRILSDLGLYEIRMLKVGNPLNKFISGGQRKRLNIALELIREPSLLLVDEPTSGLSSADSEKVMGLLKEQALKGKLVIVNIHQPSSDIFKLFDKTLFFDNGGYPIFFGNPLDAVIYFKTMSHYVNAQESECLFCGNVNPEQVLQIVEAKEVNPYGEVTDKRKVSPKSWYELYLKNIETVRKIEVKQGALPRSIFHLPNKWKQFGIFFKRNLLSKLADKQYLLINLLEAPLLAVILALLVKHFAGTDENPGSYVFGENVNIPSYFFMCVVVSLFLGMMVSAEEIIKDQKIIQREKFLHLSRFSYINSKLLLLFIISAIQTLSFLILGNLILQIRGMTLSFWLVMFTTSCCANLIGLNISAGLKSVVSIYILIPLLLVPQLLLSGVIVKFDKLHKAVGSYLNVPFVGDMMPSRWAYEALMVEQFVNNEYEKIFYDLDKVESERSIFINYVVPELQTRLEECEKGDAIRLENNLLLIRNELSYFHDKTKYPVFRYYNKLTPQAYNSDVANKAYNYLAKLKNTFSKKLDEIVYQKDKKTKEIISGKGDHDAFIDFKQKYFNQSVADAVMNKYEADKLIEYDHRLVQIAEPIFRDPVSHYGRAHFFAPYKMIGEIKIPALWFNVVAIWLMSLVLYLLLLNDVLRLLMDWFGQKYRVLMRNVHKN
jgi:ABC transport system ATP-binding/permease protein